jgi:hypothetical protein
MLLIAVFKKTATSSEPEPDYTKHPATSPEPQPDYTKPCPYNRLLYDEFTIILQLRPE